MTAGGTRPGVTRPGVAAAALRPVISATTWLAVVHLITGLFLGVLAFSLVVTFAAVGVGLIPVFLCGILVLGGTLWLCGQFGRAERARFALLLGRQIPAPVPLPTDVSGWRRLWRITWAGPTWRQFGYALARMPLSIVQACVVLVVWATALALIVLPAYATSLPAGGPALGGAVVRGPGPLTGAVLLGLLLLLAAPWVTQALAVMDGAIAAWLLGPGRRADLTARIGQLETSRAQVVDAGETERRRIERDLHDGAQQRLVSLAMELGRARAKFGSDPDAAAEIVGQAHEQAKEALTELRNLVRGVHPPVLSDRGLDAALSGLAARCPVPVTVRVDLPRRPPAAIEAIAYFVVAEALTNIAKHAHAAHAEVSVSRTADLLLVVVTDDGTGGADPAGQGLSGLAARVAGVDGRMSVISPAGGPTSIEAALPCGS
ncbi:MAG TPA: sensor domain-containing protein [Streptosporangiaceae bacterium]